MSAEKAHVAGLVAPDIAEHVLRAPHHNDGDTGTGKRTCRCYDVFVWSQVADDQGVGARRATVLPAWGQRADPH